MLMSTIAICIGRDFGKVLLEYFGLRHDHKIPSNSLLQKSGCTAQFHRHLRLIVVLLFDESTAGSR